MTGLVSSRNHSLAVALMYATTITRVWYDAAHRGPEATQTEPIRTDANRTAYHDHVPIISVPAAPRVKWRCLLVA